MRRMCSPIVAVLIFLSVGIVVYSPPAYAAGDATPMASPVQFPCPEGEDADITVRPNGETDGVVRNDISAAGAAGLYLTEVSMPPESCMNVALRENGLMVFFVVSGNVVYEARGSGTIPDGTEIKTGDSAGSATPDETVVPGVGSTQGQQVVLGEGDWLTQNRALNVVVHNLGPDPAILFVAVHGATPGGYDCGGCHPGRGGRP